VYELKNILVTVGTYTPGNGLNESGGGVIISNMSNLNIIGG